jgi:predicted transcriptional regulator
MNPGGVPIMQLALWADERDPEPPSVAAPTSKEAAGRIRPHAKAMRTEILDYIARRGGRGATTDEVEDRLGMKHQTASARVRKLAKEGLIRDSRRVRPTRSNRNAVVWITKSQYEGENHDNGGA